VRPRVLVGAYLGSTLVVGTLQTLAWIVPGLTQPVLTLTMARQGVLFLLFRLLLRSQTPWPAMTVLVCAFEVTLGMTGYFAQFREPLFLLAMALTEIFNPRKLGHWAGAVSLVVVVVVLGTLWTGVKTDLRRSYRQEVTESTPMERLDRMQNMVSERTGRGNEQIGKDFDRLVSRLWGIYHQALALRRVPEVLPHTNGALLGEALLHVFRPRLFFPEKDKLKSDSELVRRYAGIWVAGAKQDTSIAFGYVIESYIDFGVPLMFVPIFLYGLLLGWTYRVLRTRLRNQDIEVAAIVVIYWTCLYLFERSWTRTLGACGILLIIVGGGSLLLDSALTRRRQAGQAASRSLTS
jgi:hypothetical protein